MTTQGETILKEAMTLNETERRDIAERLLETLESNDNFTSDDDWFAELQRRSDEMDRDPSATVPWEQIRDEW
jgi:putative addiction module component (TIGR02574 family)